MVKNYLMKKAHQNDELLSDPGRVISLYIKDSENYDNVLFYLNFFCFLSKINTFDNQY